MRISLTVLALATGLISGSASAQQFSFQDFVAKLLENGGQPYRACHTGGYCEMGVQVNFEDGTAIFSSVMFDASERPLNRYACTRNVFADTTRCTDWDKQWLGLQCNMKPLGKDWERVPCFK